MPFLCVKCCPWDDCEGDDVVCETVVSVLPQIREAIPYDGMELLRFTYGDDQDEATARVNKIEGVFNGIDGCQDVIEASFTTVSSRRNFSLLLSSSSIMRDELKFDFRFGLAGAQPSQDFVLQYSDSVISAISPSVSVVSDVDTVLAGFSYEDLLLVTDLGATEDGKIATFFYSSQFGLVQVARIDSPLITLVQ